MTRLRFILTAFLGFGLFAGCSDSGGASGDTGSTGPAPEGTLANVQAIFDAHCINCHDAKLPVAIPYDPSLSLVAGDTYSALVNTPANAPCGGIRVVPGSPDQSFLMKKLEPTAPCYGSHMPRPFEVGPQMNLSANELETIQSWITAGAPQ